MAMPGIDDHTPPQVALADAISLLAKSLTDTSEAREVFVQRASAGEIVAFARKAHGFYGNEVIDYTDWQIPNELWLRLGTQTEQQWRRGDLVAQPIENRYLSLFEGSNVPLKLFGVAADSMTLNETLTLLPVEWISAYNAIEILLPMFKSVGATQAAIALVTRAHNGLVRTRARLFKWESPTNPFSPRGARTTQQKEFADVPKSFWWADGHDALKQNWITGDFSTYIDNQLFWQAFGVEFARVDIEAMLPQQGVKSNNERTEGIKAEALSKGGRGPAKWWADFAEELACSIFLDGLPDGKNAEGQSELLDRISQAMQDRHGAEPSRSSVQTVISKVLRRCRSAEN